MGDQPAGRNVGRRGRAWLALRVSGSCSWRGLAWRAVGARAVHAAARSTIMYHSGCTPRQPTPFEMCFMRQTISRLPRGRGDLVRYRQHVTTRGRPYCTSFFISLQQTVLQQKPRFFARCRTSRGVPARHRLTPSHPATWRCPLYSSTPCRSAQSWRREPTIL